MNEVYKLAPVDTGGFEVRSRHPGWAQHAVHFHRHTHTAEQVIVAAHANGSAKLLHHMQHTGRLPGLSGQLGQRAQTNWPEQPGDRVSVHAQPGDREAMSRR